MSEKKSFTYTISSIERRNTDNLATFHIDIGNLNEDFDNYSCEVISFMVNGHFLVANGFLLFVCDNLSEDGYFCRDKLASNQTILSHVSLNARSLNSVGNIFEIKNIRVKRRVVFSFLTSDLVQAVHETDINLAGEMTEWFLTLRLTGID